PRSVRWSIARTADLIDDPGVGVVVVLGLNRPCIGHHRPRRVGSSRLVKAIDGILELVSVPDGPDEVQVTAQAIVPREEARIGLPPAASIAEPDVAGASAALPVLIAVGAFDVQVAPRGSIEGVVAPGRLTIVVKV